MGKGRHKKRSVSRPAAQRIGPSFAHTSSTLTQREFDERVYNQYAAAVASCLSNPPDTEITIELVCTPLGTTVRGNPLLADIVASMEPDALSYVGLDFCNNENRPRFQVWLSEERKRIEVFAPFVLPEKQRIHIAGTYDQEHIRLYVDGRLVSESRHPGRLGPSTRNATLRCGPAAPLLAVRTWAIALPADLLQFLIQRGTLRHTPTRLGKGGPYAAYEGAEIGCMVVALPEIAPSESNEVRLATRILTAAGVPEQSHGSADQRLDRAATTLLGSCRQLEILLNDSETREGDLLDFFRHNPAATFLIEPDQVQIWREQYIQGYGQIDFVFRKFNRRYVAVEIEGPQHTIFLQNNEPSAQFHHATDQVKQWQKGVERNPRAAQETLGLDGIESPDGMVVIGRDRDLADPKRRERWNDMCKESAIKFQTWDEVVNRGRHLAERLGNARLPRATWS